MVAVGKDSGSWSLNLFCLGGNSFMYYGEIKKVDVANGPGARVSLFVSGCTHHCKNCFNQQTWDFQYGRPFTEQTEQEILQALQPSYISGLTMLGGEPFEPANQRCLLPFLKKVRAQYPDKNIWCFTGYLFDTELLGQSRAVCEVTREMLEQIDILVDGRFEEEKKDMMLQFRGSSNQRIIDVPASLREGEVRLWKDLKY